MTFEKLVRYAIRGIKQEIEDAWIKRQELLKEGGAPISIQALERDIQSMREDLHDLTK